MMILLNQPTFTEQLTWWKAQDQALEDDQDKRQS